MRRHSLSLNATTPTGRAYLELIADPRVSADAAGEDSAADAHLLNEDGRDPLDVVEAFAVARDCDRRAAVDGTNDAIRPAFSPDGNWVACERGPRGTLQKVPVTGGQATTIASTGVGTFDWAEDGTIVFERSNGLWRVSSAGGEPALLAMPDTARGERFLWPRTLPGSQTVVCNLAKASGGLGSIIGNPEVVAIGSDGKVTKLGIVGTNPRYLATGHLLVARSDGVVLAAPFDVRRGQVIGPAVPVLEQIVRKGGGAVEMAVSRNGTLLYVGGPPTRQVVLLDRAARATVLLQGTNHYSHPRFSPDGKHLTLQTGDIDQGDVWILDVNTLTMSRVSQDGRSAFPEWTPDGRHIVFWSGNSMRAALVRVTWDGSGVADTIAVGLQAGEMSIATASNRFVLQTTRVGADLYAGFLDSMPALRPWLATSALEENPRLSPDGKWVAYVSHETGRNEIYVRSFAGSGGRYQLSTVGGNAPRWSSDGHTVFYRVSANMSAGVGSHLIAATLRLSPAVTVVRRDTMFVDNAANISTVYGFDYDVAPDGQHFAITSSMEAMSRPVVVFDWFNELRDRMAPVAKK